MGFLFHKIKSLNYLKNFGIFDPSPCPRGVVFQISAKSVWWITGNFKLKKKKEKVKEKEKEKEKKMKPVGNYLKPDFVGFAGPISLQFLQSL